MQNNSSKIPKSFVLYRSSDDSQNIGYNYSCVQYSSGNVIKPISGDNNTFEICEIYRKIHKLFGDQFGVQKLKNTEKINPSLD